MKNNSNFLLVVIITMLFSACGGGKKALISQSDINAARSAGTLTALYDKAEKLQLDSRGSSKKELIETQSKIGSMLTENKYDVVTKALENKKTEFELVDKVTLNGLLVDIDGMKKWDLSKYEQLSAIIANALMKTENAIQIAGAKSDQSKDNIVSYMKWLKQSAILSGEASVNYSQYEKQLSQTIERLSNSGRESYKKRMFNLALSAAEQGSAIDPGNIQFESLLSQSQTALFEQEFQSSLENGKPELAYRALVDVADKPIMLQVKKKMSRNILLLANYFASNAKAAYDKGELYDAYTNFKRGRDIQKILSVANAGFIQERKFLDLVMSKANSTGWELGANYGLMQVIKEFDPDYPTLNEKLINSNENLKNRATTKLAVSEFKEVLASNSVVASVGRRVSSKLEKILFDKLGDRLQIVAELTELTESKGYDGISLAINGEVLQAAIETSQNKGQRSINVQTGINRTETEEYSKWKKRKRGEQPVQFNESKVMENITIHVEQIKKLAVVEVAYRIIEPSTKKVLLTNNITKESSHSGTSTSEFQKGLFHQKYIDAALPSEIKIMDELASQLSIELGNALLSFLASPENVFYQKYESALERGDLVEGIELLSNAVVMSSDNKGNSDWLSSLKKHVLQKSISAE